MPLSPIDLFLAGGVFMWPLLFCSLLALTLICERSIYFAVHRYQLGASLDRLKISEVAANPANPLLKVGSTITREAHGGEEHVKNVATREAAQIIIGHERGLRMLGLIGMVAPLIGLLGTVWGMVLVFAKMADLGDKVTTGDFAGGIWTALITTVGGLMVAIPAVAATRIFEGKVDRLAQDLNSVASHLHEWLFGPTSGSRTSESISLEP